MECLLMTCCRPDYLTVDLMYAVLMCQKCKDARIDHKIHLNLQEKGVPKTEIQHALDILMGASA